VSVKKVSTGKDFDIRYNLYKKVIKTVNACGGLLKTFCFRKR